MVLGLSSFTYYQITLQCPLFWNYLAMCLSEVKGASPPTSPVHVPCEIATSPSSPPFLEFFFKLCVISVTRCPT